MKHVWQRSVANQLAAIISISVAYQSVMKGSCGMPIGDSNIVA